MEKPFTFLATSFAMLAAPFAAQPQQKTATPKAPEINYHVAVKTSFSCSYIPQKDPAISLSTVTVMIKDLPIPLMDKSFKQGDAIFEFKNAGGVLISTDHKVSALPGTSAQSGNVTTDMKLDIPNLIKDCEALEKKYPGPHTWPQLNQ